MVARQRIVDVVRRGAGQAGGPEARVTLAVWD